MKKRILTLAATLLSVLQLSAGNSVRVTSPDRKIAMTFCTEKGQLQYRLEFRNKEIITTSSCGLHTEKGFVGSDVRLGKAVYRKGCEEYDLVVGKKSKVSSPWCEALVPLTDGGGNGLSVSLQIRVFDDAAAYRLIFKSNNAADGTIRIANERMDLNPVGNPTATTMFFDSFINTHEAPYVRKHIDSLDEDRLMDLPVHFEFPDGTNLAFTEADVRNYAGMYLVRKDGRLTSRLSPRLDDPRYSVILEKGGRTPWRVFMVADRPGTLMESTVLTSLCEPCRIEDCSWIKPGKTTFPWWNDTQLPDTTFQAGNNFLTNKYYIDFAADNGLEYHSVYGYADMPWYYDDGPGFGIAGPGADLTRPDPRLDFEAVCRYARSRGVDIHVWLNWAALYKDIDRVFDKFNEWGVKGMMVDFMDRDDQEMIVIQEEILRKAAEHKLFIQFHGSSKPSGLSRTWPNEFIREGTLNYEVYKWDRARTMGADHDINIPFTRGLAGPTDYHLGGFRSKAHDEWVEHYSAPYVTGTRCHMLAMYLVLDGYLGMVCDYPDAYRGQPGFEFIRELPLTWDDTRILDARISEYVVTARRKGDSWYVGCINNSKGRKISLPLDFLPEGRHELCLYSDAGDSDRVPDHLNRETLLVDSSDVIDIEMKGSGGFAMKIAITQNL
ncbi:MAG: glycoside hydrolase family 97 protein [Bacteroidales bacterium]|nr:glycoside hydrolase family 97 protein [Bacteroidales bacterium]